MKEEKEEEEEEEEEERCEGQHLASALHYYTSHCSGDSSGAHMLAQPRPETT